MLAFEQRLIKGKLEKDSQLHKRTALTPTEKADLIALCLETTDFIYNDRHNTKTDSGPIGLSLMVTVSQLWMVHTIESAIKIAQ